MAKRRDIEQLIGRQIEWPKPAPLKKVVSVYSYGTTLMEVLECGHEQLRKEDIYGPTNATRRRCKQCKEPAA